MKKTIFFFAFISFYSCCFCQQTEWTPVENIFGKKGTVQDNVFKISYPRSDLKVKVGDFSVAPGFALGSWIGFINADKGMKMDNMSGNVMMMGDLVLLDTEVPSVI